MNAVNSTLILNNVDEIGSPWITFDDVIKLLSSHIKEKALTIRVSNVQNLTEDDKRKSLKCYMGTFDQKEKSALYVFKISFQNR